MLEVSGPSGLLDFVLGAPRALRPRDPRHDARARGGGGGIGYSSSWMKDKSPCLSIRDRHLDLAVYQVMLLAKVFYTI